MHLRDPVGALPWVGQAASLRSFRGSAQSMHLPCNGGLKAGKMARSGEEGGQESELARWGRSWASEGLGVQLMCLWVRFSVQPMGESKVVRCV